MFWSCLRLDAHDNLKKMKHSWPVGSPWAINPYKNENSIQKNDKLKPHYVYLKFKTVDGSASSDATRDSTITPWWTLPMVGHIQL